MKTIGLIGGMSWESSVSYYQIINEEIKLRLGGLHSAKCILYSVDFEEGKSTLFRTFAKQRFLKPAYYIGLAIPLG